MEEGLDAHMGFNARGEVRVGTPGVGFPESGLLGAQVLAQSEAGGFVDIAGTVTSGGEGLDIGEALKLGHEFASFLHRGGEQGGEEWGIEPMRRASVRSRSCRLGIHP